MEIAAKHAQEANILMNVSEYENISDATDAFISMTQAYKELDSLDVVNKLNVTGNNFAISTAGLSSALQKSAAALKTAGKSLPEYMGTYIRIHLIALIA